MPTQFSLNCAGWPCLRWLSGYCRRSAHRVSSSVLWLHFYQGRCREVHCFHQRVFCGTGALLLPVFLLPGSQFHFKWCRILCCSRWGMHYRQSLIQMMQVRLYHLSWRVATNGLTFARIPPCWVNVYILKWDWEFIEIIMSSLSNSLICVQVENCTLLSLYATTHSIQQCHFSI